MSQLSGYPLLCVFLSELLRFTPEDTELPLELLVRMHRGRLQAPLLVLPHLGEATGQGRSIDYPAMLLEARYPALLAGRLYHTCLPLRLAREQALRDDLWKTERLLRRPETTGEHMLDVLLIETGIVYDWGSHSAAVLLYELTLGEQTLIHACKALELMLGLHTQVGTSLLALADMTRAQAGIFDLVEATRLARQDHRTAHPGILVRLRGQVAATSRKKTSCAKLEP